ncbi:ATP-binding protein [Desulfobulbus elongatus]|uniref:ATP-binding protein n=1 Tax=Desulfobulbus elongatus TaxID=53332 RepID=UPI0004843048|nr:ATP-binding protein [Desulfobulbus elongatus]
MKRILRPGLSRKILLPAVLVIALGLVLVLCIFHFNARTVVEQELSRRLQREAQLTASLLDNWLQARSGDIALWARQEVFVDALAEDGYYGRSARKGAQQLLASLHHGYPFYESIFLADRQGAILVHAAARANDDTAITLGDRPYIRATLQGQAVISPVVQSRWSGRPVFVVTAPVLKNDGVVGVIGGAVDFAAFKELFLRSFGQKQYGYAFLTDGSRQVLASSGNNEAELAAMVSADFLRRIAGQQQGTFVHRMGTVETLTVFQHLHRVDWSFNINQSLDRTLRPLYRIVQFSSVGALAVLALISLALTALVHRVVVARLRAMLRVIGLVGAGDLSQRLPPHPDPPDEVTELTDSFNAMIGQLERTLADLKEEIRVRRDTETALAHHQENLEHIIEQRSAELKKEVLERQRAEERLIRAEKLEMIGTLAGGVAHDLNNILSGIVSYPDLLLMKLPESDPMYRPLQTIRDSGQKAADIVQDLLTLARRGVAVKEPIRLDALVDVYLASPECGLLRLRHPGVEIVTEYAPDLMPLLGSPVHLVKTIMNLVTNAAESMERGGTIRLRTENRYVDNSLQLDERIGQGEYVVLEVSDQGSGIRAEDIGKIFEPFYSSKKMGRSGTGLGMAVVWGTVKDHQGFIHCESTVGVGTTFTLYFPVTSVAVQQHLRTVPPEEYRGNGERILVVDDVEEQRMIAAAILEELGYRVTVAASGEEALLLAARERFDLLLLDMILGDGMDGLATYRRWIGIVPDQRAIIASGFSENERVIEAQRLGVGRYIKKPYTIAKLGQAIREALARP